MRTRSHLFSSVGVLLLLGRSDFDSRRKCLAIQGRGLNYCRSQSAFAKLFGDEQLTSLGFEGPVAPFERLADELEDRRFRFARLGLDDFVPLVFGRRHVSALGLPFLLVLAGTVLEHVVDSLLGRLESCEVAIAGAFLMSKIGDDFVGVIKLGFRKPVVVRVALRAEFPARSVNGLDVSCGELHLPMLRSGRVEDIVTR